MMQVLKYLRLTAHWLGRALLLALVVVFGLLAWLQIPSGQQTFGQFIASELSSGNTRVTIALTSGAPPRSINMKQIAIADQDGVWARIGSLELVLDPLALISGMVQVDALRIKDVKVLRIPKGKGIETDAQPFRLPKLPVDVALDAFLIDGLRLEPAVAGVGADMRVRGRGRWTGQEISLDLDVRRLDAATDTILAELRLENMESLAANIEVTGDAGGVLAGLAGLKENQGIRASLKGDGPLDGWKGQLAAKADGIARLTGDLLARSVDESKNHAIVLGFNGTADLKDIMPPDVAERLGSGADISATARLAAGEPPGWSLDVKNKALRISAAAPGPESNTDDILIFSAETLDPAILDPWLAPATLKKAQLQGRVTGSFNKPHIHGEAGIKGYKRPDIQTGNITAVADLSLARAGSNWTGDAQIKAHAQDIALNDTPAFRKTDLTAQGHLGADQILSFNKITLSNGILTGNGKASLALNGGAASADFQLAATDLKAFAGLAGMPLEGSVTIDGSLAKGGNTAPLQFKAEAKTTDLTLGSTLADAALGPDISLIITGKQLPGGQPLGLSAKLIAKSLTIDTSGALGADQAIKADYKIKVTDSQTLGTALGVALPDNLRLAGQISGTSGDPGLSGQLTSDDLKRARLDLKNISGTFQFDHLVSAPTGTIRFNLTLPDGTLMASGHVTSPSKEIVSVDNVRITAPETNISGALTLPEKGAATGHLTGEITNLKKLARQFGIRAGGTASFALHLTDEAGNTRISAKAEADKISTVLPNRDVMKADHLTASAGALYDGTFRDVSGRISLTSLRAATATLNKLDLLVSQKKADDDHIATFHLSADGDFRGKVTLEASGVFTDTVNGFDLNLSQMDGIVYGRKLKLGQPFHITRSEFDLVSSQLDLSLGDGSLKGRISRKNGTLDTEADISNTDLILLSLAYPEMPLAGTVNGHMKLVMTDGMPKGDVSLNIDHITPGFTESEGYAPLAVKLKGTFDPDHLNFNAYVRADQISAHINSNIPLKVNTATGAVGFNSEGPVDARVNWQGEIAPVWDLMPPSDHRLAGKLMANILVSGTLADPVLKGTAALTEGAYDNLALGVVAKAAKADLKLDGRRITVQALKATDGEGGGIKAEGWVDLKPAEAFPADLKLTLDKARVVRTNDIKAAASAVLDYQRSEQAASLEGNVDIKSMDARIVNRLPADVVDIDVTEINLPPDMAATRSARTGQSDRPPYLTNLNVTAKAPRRVFVRGKGLDSEWGGNLDIRGTLEKPSISGEVELVRGTFTLAGKEVELTEGTLTFIAGSRIDPIINIKGDYQTREMTATLTLSGRSSHPSFKLTSVPELPQDEIMARILFGTSVNQLGPVEAAQLAAAVASLTGSGSGLDVLDMTRSALGLDRLRIESGTGDNTATNGTTTGTTADRSAGPLIAGGKYLTNNVYLEVETATATGESKARVVVDITRNLTVESDVGSDSSTGIGLKWKKDY